jgi:hypothetical protein
VHLRFEGRRLLEPARRLNLMAAGCYYDGPEYSRLYSASRRRPVQRMTSTVAQHNGTTYPILRSVIQKPFHYFLVLLTESLVLERLAGIRCVLQAMSRAPHLMKNVILISGALLVPDKFKNVPLQVTVVASGSLAFGNREKYLQLGELNPRSKINSSFYQCGRMGACASEMKLPTSRFDRLFYATNVQFAIDRAGRHDSPSAGTRTVGRLYKLST